MCQSYLRRVSRFLACLLPSSVNTLSGKEYFEQYLRTPEHLRLLNNSFGVEMGVFVGREGWM